MPSVPSESEIYQQPAHLLQYLIRFDTSNPLGTRRSGHERRHRHDAGAFLRAKAEGVALPGDVVLAVLCDEEAGSDDGAKFLVEEHADVFGGFATLWASSAVSAPARFRREVCGRDSRNATTGHRAAEAGCGADATPAMARYLTEQIPHARLTFFEAEGHISLSARHMPEILTAVVAAAKDR